MRVANSVAYFLILHNKLRPHFSPVSMTACAFLSMAEHLIATEICKIFLGLMPAIIVAVHNWFSNFSWLFSLMTLVPKPDTMVPKPETMVSKPDTMVPNPETMVPKPDTMTPKPETMVPKPETMTPKPETMAPRPETMVPKPETMVPSLETMVNSL